MNADKFYKGEEEVVEEVSWIVQEEGGEAEGFVECDSEFGGCKGRTM